MDLAPNACRSCSASVPSRRPRTPTGCWRTRAGGSDCCACGSGHTDPDSSAVRSTSAWTPASPRSTGAPDRRARFVTRPITAEAAGSGRAGNAPAPALVSAAVTVRFGGLVALSDVSIEVNPGASPGWSVRTVRASRRCSASSRVCIPSNAGRVLLRGEDVTNASPRARANLGLARTFQQPELFLGLTVREHLVLAYRARGRASGCGGTCSTSARCCPPRTRRTSGSTACSSCSI